MRCCVPHCKNQSRQVSKSRRISFHNFPTKEPLRTVWVKALGKQQWEPIEKSSVCSAHFLKSDIYETKSGLRKLRTGAVPCMDQTSITINSEGGDNDLKVCRVCLCTNTKVLSLTKIKLDEAFLDVTGIQLASDDRLPRQLCGECARRLRNSFAFRQKSRHADLLLTDLIAKHQNLTLKDVLEIDRNSNGLVSQLSCKYFNPNHCDLYVEYDENAETNKSVPIENEPYEVKVKYEDNEFMFENINEEIDQNTDVYINEVKEYVNKTVEENQEVVENNEQNIEENDHSEVDADFVASDYSTDDSLPLENSKTIKVPKKKEKKAKVKRKNAKKDPAEPKIDRRRKPFLNNDLNETLFTITDLTFDEQIAEIEKRQESANFKNSVYKCLECFKGFNDEDAYNGHMMRHSTQCGEHRCDICKTHFKHRHALRKHITAHHMQRFSCNHCPYTTTHRQTARLHERWHKGTKYRCPHCLDEFVKFTTYMGHIRIKHPSDFVCQLCGYSFVSQKGIDLHKKLKHRIDIDQDTPIEGPQCDLCNIRFASQEALDKHINVSARHNPSPDSKQGKESNKKKWTPNRRKLDQREDQSADSAAMRKVEGPIPCEQCGMQLEDSRAYHSHFRRMHPDKNRTNYPSMKSPCMCEVCGRMFQSYALLKDHRWVHTGERPFKCDVCGKSFRMKQRLVTHRRVHSQEKATYGCSLCGKQFSTHSNRQRHMFIHTGLKPFKCEMCGKGFKHASEKRAHITYVHLKKPWPKRARGKRRGDRQGGLPPGPDASELEMPPPLWPACNPKLQEMPTIMDDKPMYYNLKM